MTMPLDERTQSLINAVVNRIATVDDIAAFEQILLVNSEARSAYMRAMLTDSVLRQHFSISAVTATNRRIKMPRLRWPIAVAASLMVGVLWLALSSVDSVPDGKVIAIQAPQTTPIKPVNSPEIAKNTAAAGRMMASDQAVWSSGSPAVGAELQPGILTLTAGRADFTFGDGAHVQVTAPASVEIISAERIKVHDGHCFINVQQGALGFIVETPQSTVVDLGTSYDLSVGQEHGTEVQVMRGELEVFSAQNTDSPQRHRFTEGQSFSISHDRTMKSGATSTVGKRDHVVKSSMTDLGVEMMKGDLRFCYDLNDLFPQSEAGKRVKNVIHFVTERRNVALKNPIEVNIDEPGYFRSFTDSKIISISDNVDSYLIHLRPVQDKPSWGLLIFDRPVVGIICTADLLRESDATFIRPGIVYPTFPGRGLETDENSPDDDGIILSADRKRLRVRLLARPKVGGIDEIRVLVNGDPNRMEPVEKTP